MGTLKTRLLITGKFSTMRSHSMRQQVMKFGLFYKLVICFRIFSVFKKADKVEGKASSIVIILQ